MIDGGGENSGARIGSGVAGAAAIAGRVGSGAAGFGAAGRDPAGGRFAFGRAAGRAALERAGRDGARFAFGGDFARRADGFLAFLVAAFAGRLFGVALRCFAFCFFFLPMGRSLAEAQSRGPARHGGVSASALPASTDRRFFSRFMGNSRGPLHVRTGSVDDPLVSSRSAPARNSAFAVILHRARVLLVRPARKRRWQLPGGGMKRRETPRETAVREVDEETGLSVRLLGVTGVYPRRDGSRAIVFAARAASLGPLGPRNEIEEQRWVPLDDAARLLGRRVRRRLADAVAASGRRGGLRAAAAG